MFSSSVNPETTLHFFNAWRPILQGLLVFHCTRKDLSKEDFMVCQLIESGNENKLDLMCEIFGVQKSRVS